MPLPVVIDTDPAIGYLGRDVDDGLAILALLADPAIEVLGLSVTFGNVSLSKGVKKAKELLRRVGKGSIPVYAGAESSLDLDRETEASSFLQRSAREHRGALQVLAIGPLTNLATAALDTRFRENLGALVVLGGVLSPPSRFTQRPGFEFNLRQDIQAARRILAVGDALTVFPMEVCRLLRLGPMALWRLYRLGGVASWAAQSSLLWELLSPLLWCSLGFHPWDVLPALSLSRPEIFGYHSGHYRLGSRGELSPEAPQGTRIRLAVQVDRTLFWREFWARFSHYGVRIGERQGDHYDVS